MEEQKRVLTTMGINAALGFEDYDYTETTSAWYISNVDELETRKYGDAFNPKMNKVRDWVYKHKDIIWDTPFEEQERMMIADGVLTPEDI